MKKLVKFIFIISLIFISILSFLDYSLEILNKIENNLSIVEIKKPKNISNDKFINDLMNFFKENNEDIIYKSLDNSKSKSNKEYYITTNKEFLNKKQDLDNKGVLTTLDNSLIGSSFLYDVTIYNFKKIKDYNLDDCTYYINRNSSEKIINGLIKKGYNVKKINFNEESFSFISLKFLLLPYFLLFISIIFCGISKRKENLCKRIMGYTKKNIIIYDCLNNIKIFGLVTISVQIIVSTIISIVYPNSFLDYFRFSSKNIVEVFVFAIIFLILSDIFNLGRNEIGDLKGKFKNLDIYIVTLILKMILCIFLIVNITTTFKSVRYIYELNKRNEYISKKIKNYVSLPMIVSSGYIGEDKEKELDKMAYEFYNNTVDKLNGVLINTSFYDPSNPIQFIIINDNYLNINPINNLKKKLISKNNLKSDYLNIIIPQKDNNKKEEIKNAFSSMYNINKNKINIVEYLDNEKIYSFNTLSGRNTNGLIENPVIVIYEPKLIKIDLLGCISGEEYLLETTSENPFNEIKPYLKKYKLDNFIKQTPYVSNTFDAAIWRTKQHLVLDSLNLSVYIIGIVVLVIYNSKIYFNIYRKDIVYKRISGYKFIEIYKVPLIIQFLQLILLLIVKIKLPINLYFILGLEFIELIVFIISLKFNEMKNMIPIIKGED